jgi:membrane-associated phospholipid phosphatase
MTALLPARARRVAMSTLTCCVIFVGVGGTVVLRLRLDTGIDSVVVRAVGQHQTALRLVAGLGEKVEVGALTLILFGLCLALRRLNGALLAAVAIPIAPALTEYVLKPLFVRLDPNFPSGHTTAAFAVATVVVVLLATPGKRISRAWRLVIASTALLAGAAVFVAVIALGMHSPAEALGGAAVGAGVALLVALLLDLPLVRRLVTWAWDTISELPRRVRGTPSATGADRVKTSRRLPDAKRRDDRAEQVGSARTSPTRQAR